MKYFTATIPLDLAEKLKEKGMPMPVNYADLPDGTLPTFSFVFDWLMEEKIYISITQQWVYANGEATAWIPVVNCHSNGFYHTWHEAANAAIEKALTLI